MKEDILGTINLKLMRLKNKTSIVRYFVSEVGKGYHTNLRYTVNSFLSFSKAKDVLEYIRKD